MASSIKRRVPRYAWRMARKGNARLPSQNGAMPRRERLQSYEGGGLPEEFFTEAGQREIFHVALEFMVDSAGEARRFLLAGFFEGPSGQPLNIACSHMFPAAWAMFLWRSLDLAFRLAGSRPRKTEKFA